MMLAHIKLTTNCIANMKSPEIGDIRFIGFTSVFEENISNDVTKRLHHDYIPRNKITRENKISILGSTHSNNKHLIEKTLQDVTKLKENTLNFF